MKKELEIEFEKDYSGNIKVEYSLKENDIEVEISGSLKKYHTGRADEYEFQPSYFTNEESETYYDENWEKIEEQILSAFYTKKMADGGMMAKGGMTVGSEIVGTKKMYFIYNNETGKKSKYYQSKEDAEKELNNWKKKLERLASHHYKEGVVLVKSAKASNHNEVWDILNEKWKKYKIVNSRAFDLETPYNRGWIDEGISINVFLLKDTKTNKYYWDSDYIEAKKNKMADGGMIAKDKLAFGMLSFEELENIFNVRLFGLNEDDTEKLLDKLKDGWFSLETSERIEILNEYHPNWKKYADGGMMAKGGMTKRKRYAEMEKGGIVYDIEWKDEEGDTFEASFDSLEKAKEEIKQIEKEGGRIVQTWKYKDGEYVGRFEYGGELEYDVTDEDRGYFNQYMKEAKEIYGEEKWDNLSRQEKIDATKYLKQKGWIGYKKGGFIRKRF